MDDFRLAVLYAVHKDKILSALEQTYKYIKHCEYNGWKGAQTGVPVHSWSDDRVPRTADLEDWRQGVSRIKLYLLEHKISSPQYQSTMDLARALVRHYQLDVEGHTGEGYTDAP